MAIRQLSQGEIYSKTQNTVGAMVKDAVIQQLAFNNGIISPEHIQTGLLELENKAKGVYYPFISDAIALYKTRGLIRLFNLSVENGGRSKIPTSIPFLRAMARNRYKENDSYATNGNGKDIVLFVNMYHIGNWSADENSYIGLSSLTDLYSCLETGVIAYKMIVNGETEKVFNDKDVIEYMTKIYVSMFSSVMQKTKTGYGNSEFQNDAANFLIAKFFLSYVLGKDMNDTLDDYAYLAVNNHSSLEALKSYEEISSINYDSLSGFLSTFGSAFYNGSPVLLPAFENNWARMYGDPTSFAIEYAPFLMHFLFATIHGSNLGGSSRLISRANDLNKIGLQKLYKAVINVLK